jgi:epoxyqueuosine reductase
MSDRLTSDLGAVAKARGVVGFGVCEATPFDDVRVGIERRRADGLAGSLTFTFTNPARSTNVRESLPWARRLVVCAVPYLAETGNPPERAAHEGRVARFAVEDAYRPLRRTLGELASMLRDGGHRAEVLVDDNRLVDRAAAVRAGVGWWGKNTMVLVPGAGPWVLLGSVATDVLLGTTPPMVRSCGTCVACLPACPTGALVSPGVLDARRCLAAIAQSPGVIPRDLRPAMGDRVYGCDDCLEACPPGRRSMERVGMSRAGIVDLIELLRAADRTLLLRYEHFYIPKRDPRYLRRNALVAAGNSNDVRFAGLLAGYLGHPDPLLRLHAAWALTRLKLGRASLEAAARHERDSEVAEELHLGLAALRDSERVR